MRNLLAVLLGVVMFILPTVVVAYHTTNNINVDPVMSLRGIKYCTVVITSDISGKYKLNLDFNKLLADVNAQIKNYEMFPPEVPLWKTDSFDYPSLIITVSAQKACKRCDWSYMVFAQLFQLVTIKSNGVQQYVPTWDYSETGIATSAKIVDAIKLSVYTSIDFIMMDSFMANYAVKNDNDKYANQ